MRAYLNNHILPFFDNKKLQKINTRMIESWIMALKEKPGRTKPVVPVLSSDSLILFLHKVV
jgi:hypothetical protein